MDGQEDSEKTQARCAHLIIVSDPLRKLVQAAAVVHAHAGPSGVDIAAPTTFLIDQQGKVKWLFRPGSALERLSAAEVLDAVDKYLVSK